MSAYLWDTSALCKRYFVNEVGSAWVRATIDDPAHEHYIIILTIPEFLNACYRLTREGHLTDTQRRRIVARFYADITNKTLRVEELDKRHFSTVEPIIEALQAMTVTNKRPGPFDALVVSFVVNFNQTSLTLASSDADLNTLAQTFNIPTVDPKNPPP